MLLPKTAGSSRPLADVAVYSVQKRSGDRNKRPWVVRWSLNGRQRSRSFRTKTEADRYRAGLLVAQQGGEPFDADSGEPVSWLPRPDELHVHDWARRWLAEQWTEWAPRTRWSAVEALSRFLPLAVRADAPPPPASLRRHLVAWLPPDGTSDDDDAAAWLERSGLRLGQLTRSSLALVDQQLARRDDGSPLASSTASRFRKVSRACIRRAVELGLLDVDPWPIPPRGRAQRKSVRAPRAAARALPDPATMARVIAAIPSQQPASRMYQVMTAVAYYGGLRPSEVVMLRASALELPASGWGRINVTEADVAYDEPGEPKTGPRSVPIPPVLVELLRDWLTETNRTADALLFRTRTDSRPSPSNWSRSMQRALRNTGTAPMRIYDCRHAAATTWLQAGVPLGEAARRLGHSVETLVSTYVGVLETDEATANKRIDTALNAKAAD